MPRPSEQSIRTWGAAAHAASLTGLLLPFGNILGPLLVWILKRDAAEFIDDQGKEALNFQITLLLYFAVAGMLFFLLFGAFLLYLLLFYWIGMVLIAAAKSSRGERYRYPFTLRLIQ